MVKDRNKSTTVILRNFNCELIDKLKKFTGENTNTKAIEIVCARYLALEKLADEQKEKIKDLDESLESVIGSLKCSRKANKNLDDFIEKEGWRTC